MSKNTKKRGEAHDAMEKIFPMIFAALAAVLVTGVIVELTLMMNH